MQERCGGESGDDSGRPDEAETAEEAGRALWEVTAELRSGPPEQLPARLCAACVRILPVTGASISVHGNRGNRLTLAASDQAAAELAEIQYSLGEGPCWEANELRAPVSATDLTQGRDARRWPLFAREAVAIGAVCAFSVPLGVGGSALGTLDLYGASPGALPEDEMRIALWAADAVALALTVSQRGQSEGIGAGVAWMAKAETSHDAVYQATGMLMVRRGIDADAAMATLRARAFSLGRTVTEVARDIINRTDDFSAGD